jgi:hypothetical protein
MSASRDFNGTDIHYGRLDFSCSAAGLNWLIAVPGQ